MTGILRLSDADAEAVGRALADLATRREALADDVKISGISSGAADAAASAVTGWQEEFRQSGTGLSELRSAVNLAVAQFAGTDDAIADAALNPGGPQVRRTL